MLRMGLVILDELGYLPFCQAGGALLFHLFSRLYEHTSVMIAAAPVVNSFSTEEAPNRDTRKSMGCREGYLKPENSHAPSEKRGALSSRPRRY